MNRRTLLSAAAAAVALLFVGYSVYWWLISDRLAAGIDQWIAAERQAGLAIDTERTPIGGYPLWFSTTFGRPHVHGMLAGQPVDWQGADVAARVGPFDLRSVRLATSGDHKLALGTAGAALHAEALDIRLRFDARGRLSSLATESGAATVTLPDGRTAALQAATASFDAPSQPPQSDQDPLLQFSLSATALHLPSGIQFVTAAPLDAIAVQGTVKGPIPAAPLKQALASWRDQGGIVEITSLTVAQAPLAVSGSATVALDAALQPIVAANLAAKGLGPAIDLLAQQKRIAANDVLKVKLFIAATERDAPDGGKQVTSGLTIQNGVLSLGPFRIARVAKVEWP